MLRGTAISRLAIAPQPPRAPHHLAASYHCKNIRYFHGAIDWLGFTFSRLRARGRLAGDSSPNQVRGSIIKFASLPLRPRQLPAAAPLRHPTVGRTLQISCVLSARSDSIQFRDFASHRFA